MTLDYGRRAVKIWAVMMIAAGFAILVSEAVLHFCHVLTPKICATDAGSLFWVIVGFVSMLVGGIILWRERVAPVLQSFRDTVPTIINLINSIRPGGRRSTDPPAGGEK